MEEEYSEKWYIENADQPQDFFPEEWVEHFLNFSNNFLEDFKTEIEWKSLFSFIVKEDFTCSLAKFKKILKISNFDVNTMLFDEHTLLTLCVESMREDFIIHLLNSGADPNIGLNYDEQPSLYTAIQEKNYHLIKLLLSHGANPNLIAEDSSTIFSETVFQYEGSHIEFLIIETMIKQGGDPCYTDISGDSFHQWYKPGESYEELYFLLVKHGMKTIEQYDKEQEVIRSKNIEDNKLIVFDIETEISDSDKESESIQDENNDKTFKNMFEEIIKGIDMYNLFKNE